MNRSIKLVKSGSAIIGISIIAFQWGCAGPAASKTVKGAGTGAAIGAVGGLITGQDMGGVAAAAAAGGAVGAAIGAVQEVGRQATGHPRPARSLQPSDCHAKAGDRKAALQEGLEIRSFEFPMLNLK